MGRVNRVTVRDSPRSSIWKHGILFWGSAEAGEGVTLSLIMAISQKYPAGLPAFAILVIRLTLSSHLLLGASWMRFHSLQADASLLVAAGLLLGLCTRLVAAGSLPLFLWASPPGDWAHAAIDGQAGIALALGMLGGGALSLDALMFGRHVVRVRGRSAVLERALCGFGLQGDDRFDVGRLH